MTTSKTIVIGDVHGCLEQLDELLRKVQYKSGDRLVFAGDLVDRGPEPVGVVRRAIELRADAVLGNHDAKHLQWRKNENLRRLIGKENKMRFSPGRAADNASFSEEEMEWLRSLPYYIHLSKSWIVVHAGFTSVEPIADQGDDVTRIRYVNQDGTIYKGDNFHPDPTVVRWATRWKGPENVIYGHAVYSLEDPTVDQTSARVTCYGIDTGCCYGGRLTAFILQTREFVQVQCPTRYARWFGEGDD